MRTREEALALASAVRWLKLSPEISRAIEAEWRKVNRDEPMAELDAFLLGAVHGVQYMAAKIEQHSGYSNEDLQHMAFMVSMVVADLAARALGIEPDFERAARIGDIGRSEVAVAQSRRNAEDN